MRQVLFEIPGLHVKLFGYGLMLFFAFLSAMNLAAWRAKRVKLDPELVYDFALWVFIGGLIGARLFYAVQYWGDKVHNLADVFKIWQGGIVLYGSIMGGAAGFFLYWRLRPFPLRPMLDVLAPSLALGIAIGRIGCFLNGCCYGDRCDLSWAVAFPAGSPPWAEQVATGLIDRASAWSLPVHPTQLYSAVDGLIILLLLTAYYPLRRRDGGVMALLMVTYPLSRLFIEWLRNDEPVFLAGMTISQNISLLLLACGIAFWVYLSRLPRTRHADTAPDPTPIASSQAEPAGV